MGALIMAHSDDDGLVLPPKMAPLQVVIVPIFKNDEQLNSISEVADRICKDLKSKNISVKYDNRDTHKPGWKFSEYEFKGVPVRIAIGPRDIENGTVEVARRDTKEKSVMQLTDIHLKIEHLLDQIQDNMYRKALNFRETHTFNADNYDEFKKLLDEGGFIYAHWDGTTETELKIKEETKATIRCIPLNNKAEAGKCIYSGKPSTQRVVFARAY
jgi:prolyl-tRNA synthetase